MITINVGAARTDNIWLAEGCLDDDNKLNMKIHMLRPSELSDEAREKLESIKDPVEYCKCAFNQAKAKVETYDYTEKLAKNTQLFSTLSRKNPHSTYINLVTKDRVYDGIESSMISAVTINNVDVLTFQRGGADYIVDPDTITGLSISADHFSFGAHRPRPTESKARIHKLDLGKLELEVGTCEEDVVMAEPEMVKEVPKPKTADAQRTAYKMARFADMYTYDTGTTTSTTATTSSYTSVRRK